MDPFMPANAYFQKLLQFDRSSPHFADQLCGIIDGKEFDEQVSSLDTNDLVKVIEYLDKVLDGLDPVGVTFRRILQKLQGLCISRMCIPLSYVLPLDLLNVNKKYLASGGFSDVFRGTYGDREVCVKRLRVSFTDGPEKMLYREALIWRRLIHPNVVPFIGVTFNPLQIVSEWMSGGNLTSHIKSNPQVNRVHLLIDVAKGLDYLHQCEVVHGDLKGPNIMVDIHGRAQITDFGLARNRDAAEQTRARAGGTARWTAPEILKGQGTPSKKGDVFSFAMVMVEAFTGSAPFDLHLSITVTLAIMQGDRPLRPSHPAFTDDLWKLMQRCWSQESSLRPDMSEVSQVLRSLEHSHMTSLATLQQLHRFGGFSSDFHDRLSDVLHDEGYKQLVPNLKDGDLVWLVDFLDQALDSLDPSSSGFQICLCELRNICGTRTILPTSYTLSLSLRDLGRHPVIIGGSDDVYEGTLNDSKVCVKRVRVYPKDGPKKTPKAAYQEAVVWKCLKHQNIVPFRGATLAPLQFISDWMPGGDLTEYIKKDPSVDRLNLLSGVAGGLQFLHSRDIVHGDLKGPNILVDADGHARITDFRLSAVVQNPDSTGNAPDCQGHIARWTAPEILNEQGGCSKGADVFSFAMVMIEVFTGAAPFDGSSTEEALLAIMSGRRPSRPTHTSFTDELWMLTQRCWDQDPRSRPGVPTVLNDLGGS